MKTTTPPIRNNQAGFDGFPAAWRALIQELEQLQATLKSQKALGQDWGDAEFVAGSSLPASTWNLLKHGTHPRPSTQRGIQAVTTKLTQLQQVTREVQLRIVNADVVSAQQPQILTHFVEDVNAAAVIAALEKCDRLVRDQSEERLVVIRAATGEGKSWLRKWMVAKGHVHYVVSARPSWRRNYSAFLKALAGVLHVGVEGLRAVADIEAEIMVKARSIAGVVWFEEVQQLSVDAQEFLKLLLNETNLTLLLAMTPEAYNGLRHRAHGDTLQLFRRAACNMELAHADGEYLLATAPEVWEKKHEAACEQRVLAEAEIYGGRALIADVNRRLRDMTRGSTVLTLAQVNEAILQYRANVPDLTAATRAFGQPKAKAA